ncbi:MAG: DUF5666 domain-containing protein [bacterium]
MITVAAVCALAGSSAPALVRAPRALAAAAGPAVLARGWARVTAAGTLVSVAPSGGFVSVAIGSPGRVDVFDGGTVWRSRALSGTHLIHLLAQTVMADSAARPIGWNALRSGDRVAVWGVMSPDEEIMALSMVVATAHQAARSTAPAAGTAGVVTGRSGAMLDLMTNTGTRHAVLLTAATQVRSGGPPAAPAVAPFDIVQVDGALNSDGSIVAARVSVEFLASQAAQVSGPIEAVRGDVGGLIVGGTMVCTSAQTYFVRGASRLWITQLAAGRPVTVYGLPILAGKTPVGLAARVVAIR